MSLLNHHGPMWTSFKPPNKRSLAFLVQHQPSGPKEPPWSHILGAWISKYSERSCRIYQYSSSTGTRRSCCATVAMCVDDCLTNGFCNKHDGSQSKFRNIHSPAWSMQWYPSSSSSTSRNGEMLIQLHWASWCEEPKIAYPKPPKIRWEAQPRRNPVQWRRLIASLQRKKQCQTKPLQMSPYP